MPFICHSYAIHMPFSALLEDNLQLPDGSIYSGESDAEFGAAPGGVLSQLSQLDGMDDWIHSET